MPGHDAYATSYGLQVRRHATAVTSSSHPRRLLIDEAVSQPTVTWPLHGRYTAVTSRRHDALEWRLAAAQDMFERELPDLAAHLTAVGVTLADFLPTCAVGSGAGERGAVGLARTGLRGGAL